ncbi:hypothetical protein FQN55_002691 [Onygenales sp. PD_40]|nr:hypothetical protein FQN55_002691 [Onygenales sp. PD_40]KAK2793337.1 hypothetical protein FQN52_001474 [Onygenales sp. PD_12]KAK2797810.1 hypothetical protein FQN51_008266 [Onygenales sp. PD_10]
MFDVHYNPFPDIEVIGKKQTFDAATWSFDNLLNLNIPLSSTMSSRQARTSGRLGQRPAGPNQQTHAEFRNVGPEAVALSPNPGMQQRMNLGADPSTFIGGNVPPYGPGGIAENPMARFENPGLQGAMQYAVPEAPAAQGGYLPQYVQPGQFEIMGHHHPGYGDAAAFPNAPPSEFGPGVAGRGDTVPAETRPLQVHGNTPLYKSYLSPTFRPGVDPFMANPIENPPTAEGDQTQDDPERFPSGIVSAVLYRCEEPMCDKKFGRSQHLLRHMASHTGEKPHVCWVPDCGRKFSRSDNLRVHCATTHGKKMGSNTYVATLDDTSKYYDPEYRGELTADGRPVGPRSDGGAWAGTW